MTIHDYHRALEKIMTSPLTLTEHDFDVLRSFNPGDETRGRDAVRRLQLAIVPTAATIQTNTAPLVPPAGPRLSPAFADKLGRVTGAAIRAAVMPLHDRTKALTTRLEQLEEFSRQQAMAMTKLRDENKALGDLVTLGLESPRRSPSRDLSRPTKH